MVSTRHSTSSRVPAVSGSAIRPSMTGPQANSAVTSLTAAASSSSRASRARMTWVASVSVITARVWTEQTREAWMPPSPSPGVGRYGPRHGTRRGSAAHG